MSGKVCIGISGWRYAPWRGVFYPQGLRQRDELAYAASKLQTIEINGSFYSLQRPEHYLAWRDATPEHFVFAVKGSRYLTHLLRLKEIDAPLANFFASGVLALGAKLGPFLWQFPPWQKWDEPRFEAFFERLPRDTTQALKLARGHDDRVAGRSWLKAPRKRQPLRHAIEVRHDSFVAPSFHAAARRHGLAIVVADTAGRWPLIEETTADFVYVRLHGDTELYASGYGEAALDAWAGRIVRWRDAGLDVYCYFDNDIKVHAPFDAQQLAARL